MASEEMETGSIIQMVKPVRNEGCDCVKFMDFYLRCEYTKPNFYWLDYHT